MTITEVIKALEKIRDEKGDLRVTIYDEYTAEEGWGFKKEDLWLDVDCTVDYVLNDNDKQLEEVVLIG